MVEMTRAIDVNNLSENLCYKDNPVITLFHFLDTLNEPSIPKGDLSIAFVPIETIQQIHNDFLNDPTATDVITFPGDSALDFAGEICVCADVAISFARQNSIAFQEELTRYLIHGWLHLAGYDDYSTRLQEIMRATEDRLLKIVKTKQLLPLFQLYSAEEKKVTHS